MPRYDIKERMKELGFSDLSILCESGVYVLGYCGEIVWVGKSTRLGGRAGDNKREFDFDSVYVLPVDIVDLDVIEARLILGLRPRYNVISPFDLFHKARGKLLGTYDQAKRRRILGVIKALEVRCHEEDMLLLDDVRNSGWPEYPDLSELTEYEFTEEDSR